MRRPGMKHLQLWKKKEYFDSVIGEFVDQFVMADPDKEAVQHNKTQGLLTGHCGKYLITFFVVLY